MQTGAPREINTQETDPANVQGRPRKDPAKEKEQNLKFYEKVTLMLGESICSILTYGVRLAHCYLTELHAYHFAMKAPVQITSS